ncbi:MAG: aspartate carbamoyltransferase regulatory subunit [Bacteroidales bacterium]|jgi:aspartate carbamoyltransferase regulatory subunit|nr:aspartate carbamoyltransferase regulatory subunit [Bacteroidales bacterium]MBQ5404149.1 aspartate carbamoyltransferase regulatory subunit [Bacteroidales bacterium]
MDKSELKVSAIKDGTVIDHIPAKDLFKVIKILNLESVDNQVTFGTNLDSKKLGKKAIIKVSDKFFQDSEINKIALIAPNANLNIIKNYEVVEKSSVELPQTIKGICKCMNPKCITNSEPMQTKFDVISQCPPALRCFYCGKVTDQEHFVII